jgi:hypothetical protein
MNIVVYKIVFKPLQTNLFNIVLISFFLTVGCGHLYSQDISKKNQKTVILPKSRLSSVTNVKQETEEETRRLMLS